MADTLKIPGIGDVKKEYVIGGGALVAGIVGYAYWRRARDQSSEEQQIVVAANDVIPATDYVNPSPGGSSPVVVENNEGSPPVPRTNPEWTQRATDYLTQIGYDPIFIAEALGRFLTRQPLSDKQKDAVRAAVGAWGPPPEGGPWPIGVDLPSSPSPSPPTTDPPAPPPSVAPKWPNFNWTILLPRITVPKPSPPKAQAPPPPRRTYVVKRWPLPGSSLWSIAGIVYGNSSRWPEIARANNIGDPKKIQPGQVLTIP